MSHDGKQADEEQLQWCMNVQVLVWRKVWQVEWRKVLASRIFVQVED